MREPDRQLPARYVLYTHLGLVRGNGGIYDVIKKVPEDECLRTGCLRSCDRKKLNKKKKNNSCSFHSLPLTSRRDDHTRVRSHSSAHKECILPNTKQSVKKHLKKVLWLKTLSRCARKAEKNFTHVLEQVSKPRRNENTQRPRLISSILTHNRSKLTLQVWVYLKDAANLFSFKFVCPFIPNILNLSYNAVAF